MATGLFLELAEVPATGSLGTGQSDTCDLLVAGVRISISPKYLNLYLELTGSTIFNTGLSEGTALSFVNFLLLHFLYVLLPMAQSIYSF